MRLILGFMFIALMLLVVKRKQIASWRKPNQRELTLPFCPKCESNRRTVANRGDIYPKTEYLWWCLTCQEAF